MRLRAPSAALVALVASALCALVACGTAAPRFQRAEVSTSIVTAPTTTAPAIVTTTAGPPPTTAKPPAVSSAALAKAKAVTSSTGVVLTVTGHRDGGVDVLTPCENTVHLDAASVVKAPTVILDPGHGGTESGAVGPNGLTEKAVNLAVARQARDALAAANVSALLTRTNDYEMTLTARTTLVNALKPKVFVSVHHNADPDGPHDGPGSETYYQIASPSTNGASKRLAGLLYEEIVAALKPYNVAWVGDTDAGAKYRVGSSGDDYYAILRQTKGTITSLAELAFISNAPEADLLARPDVQKVEGQAVARGIVRFLTTNDPGSGYTTPYPRTTPAGGGGGKTGCVDPAL
jgi:N-acetylmuramoyl-L-alanine amidase